MDRVVECGDCPVCGGTVALMVSRRGDGSRVVLRNHGPNRGKCPGSRDDPISGSVVELRR